MADTLKRVSLWSLVPALIAAVTIPVLGVPLAGAPAASAAPASTAAPAADEQSPLSLTLTTMSPSSLPANGPVRLRGTVTNTSDDTWSTVNVYPFASWNSSEPTVISSAEQLAQETTRAPEEAVGERFTDVDNYRTITELAPGQSANYTATITADQVQAASEPGVYWIGVHALGESASVPRDGYADGRARTFIPLVAEDATPVPTTIVAGIRGGARYGAAGRVSDPDSWKARLAPEGSLGRLVSFGDQSPIPISWLVDPSIPDAVQRLAAGNPTRSLDPTGTDNSDEPDDGASEEPSDNGSNTQLNTDPAADDGAESSSAANETAATAREWLDQTGDMLEGSEVLLLPFGDTDVSSSVAHDPGWYTRTRERSGSILEPWQLPGTPTVAAPNGLLSPEALAAVREGTTVLLSDTVLPGENPPTNVNIDGLQMWATDGDIANGGPGPDNPLGPVSLRQQLLSKVALRTQADEPEPVVMVLPPSWQAPRGEGSADRFFDGLDVSWLQPSTLADLSTTASTVVPAEDITLPEDQLDADLPAENFASARQLAETGARMGRVLFRNDSVADEVIDEAMASTSYAAARTPILSRLAITGAETYLLGQLALIQVEDPLPVTLSSETGEFGVTLVNGLDQAVEVRLVAESDGEVQVTMPGRIRLQANARTTVYPTASTGVLGRHDAILRVTDLAGNPTGGSAVVQVRATQVSKAIWVIIGLGLVLLFSAILLRLVRRTREALR